MLRRLRKPAVVLAASAAAVLGLAGATAASAAPSHHAAVSRPATATEGVLSNSVGDAKFNSSSGLWRLAAHGTNTKVLVLDESGYYLIQDETSGNYMAWSGPSADQVNETSNSSLVRAHWARSYCNPGASYSNDYASQEEGADSYLDGSGVGFNLDSEAAQCFVSYDIWSFSGTIGS